MLDAHAIALGAALLEAANGPFPAMRRARASMADADRKPTVLETVPSVR